jgi:hypothetical protein
MKLMRVFTGLLLSTAIIWAALPLPTHAQTPPPKQALGQALSQSFGQSNSSNTDGISLQISPLPIELSAKPGSSVSTELRVRNAGTKPERLQVRLLAVSQDNNGNVHLSNPKPTDEYTKWVSFDRTVFAAPPGEWQTIHMNVNVPKSAAFGYYFAVEYLRASDVAPQPGKAVAHGAVATFILLNADAAGAKREAQIVSFTADRKSYEFLPSKFTVKVKATGNVHVAPYGNVFIGKGSKQAGNINVNAEKGKVLPGGSRFFVSSWSDGFPVYVAKTNADGSPVLNKKGQEEKSLKWDFAHANKLRFGKYTAHLLMVYDNGSRDIPMEATVSFWVVPWRVIGIIVGILALIGALITYIIILRRKLKRAKRTR